jgi:hypothetical protein
VVAGRKWRSCAIGRCICCDENRAINEASKRGASGRVGSRLSLAGVNRVSQMRLPRREWGDAYVVECDGVGRTVTQCSRMCTIPENEAKRCSLRSWSCWSRKTLEFNMSTQGLCARQDVGHGRILTSCNVLQDAEQPTTASSRCAPVHAVRPPSAAGKGTQNAETRQRMVMASGDAQKAGSQR